MRLQILKLIIENKKAFLLLLKKRPEFWNWVLENCDSNSINDKTKLYTALYGIKMECECKSGKFKRYETIFKNLWACSRKCTFLNAIANAKRENSCHEIYGEKTNLLTSDTQTKIRKTMLENWGVEKAGKSPLIRAKIKATNLRERGVECVLSDSEIKNKIKNTNKERRGVENPFQCQDVKNKIKENLFREFGCFFTNQKHLLPGAIEIINDKLKFSELLDKNGAFLSSKILGISHRHVYKIHDKFNLDIFKTNSSSYENEIITWLNEHNIVYKHGDRTQIKPKELDFFFPNHNFAIEFQGDYWHMNPIIFSSTDINKKRNLSAQLIWDYDENKITLCKNLNIKLIHIWELDWIQNKNQIKDNILKYIGGIYAESN